MRQARAYGGTAETLVSKSLGAGMFGTVAKRVYRGMRGPAVTADPVRAWRGTARGDLPLLRVMDVGDCSIRAMDHSHDFKAPIGYPKVMAEQLLDAGVGTEFAHYFAITYEHLPSIERLRSSWFSGPFWYTARLQLPVAVLSFAATCICCDTRSPPLKNQRGHRRRMDPHPLRATETASHRYLRPMRFFP